MYVDTSAQPSASTCFFSSRMSTFAAAADVHAAQQRDVHRHRMISAIATIAAAATPSSGHTFRPRWRRLK